MKSRWSVLLCGLVLVILLAPMPGRGQLSSPCCAILQVGLSTISSILRNVVAPPLAAIQDIQKAIYDFERAVIWPQEAIARARSIAGQVQAIYWQIRALSRLSVASTTLAKPRQLEQVLLSRDASRVDQVSASYTQVYGPVTPPTDAAPAARDLIDITDAQAQAAMKRAIAIDALAELQLEAADRLAQEIRVAAPGSAPILEAQAAAMLVRANAFTQSALADLLRVRAIGVANSSAELKFGATHGTTVRKRVDQLLKR